MVAYVSRCSDEVVPDGSSRVKRIRFSVDEKQIVTLPDGIFFRWNFDVQDIKCGPSDGRRPKVRSKKRCACHPTDLARATSSCGKVSFEGPKNGSERVPS